MPKYNVNVNYQTASGGNTKKFNGVEATNDDHAINLCNARVRRMRGVLKVDGGDVEEIKDNSAETGIDLGGFRTENPPKTPTTSLHVQRNRHN